MATEGTKFQINYKLNDGTLINLYAANVQELETGLTDLSMVSALVKSTGAELGGFAAYNAATNNGQMVAPATDAIRQAFPGATPVSLPNGGQGLNVSTQNGGHTCKHGVMSLRSGVGQKGPWSGYMCAAPKGAPDKCDTIWVR
jgi:hypothetical protein